LRSRGIDLEAARGLLTYAFASEMIGRIKVEPVRAQIETLLLTRLPEGSQPAMLRSLAGEGTP
jgi:Fe-S cluster assembly protein SufD